MKKLFAISILFTLLTAAAFAQFGFKITGEFYPNLLLVTAPTGDAAQVNNEKTLAGKVPYGGVGTFDFLTASDWPAGKGLSATFSYEERDEKRYGGKIQLAMGSLIERGSAFFAKSGDTVRFTDILGSYIGDWDVWGKAGIFTGKVGNTGVDGVVSGYDGALDFLLEGVKYTDYGIILPGDPDANYNHFGTGSGIGMNSITNFPVAQFIVDPTAGRIKSPSLDGRPTFSLVTDLSPIKIGLAGDMTNIIKDGKVNDEGYSTVGAAIRVSGDKIADLVSFDAVYKFAGGDYDTENQRSNNSQPSGDGNWGHAFGLFANLSLIDTLGIGVGYSGFMSVQEKFRDPQDQEYTFRFPYYNGVDLKFSFTGVDKLTISFINNISFSTIKGTDEETTYTVGLNGTFDHYQSTYPVGGTALTDSDMSDGYLALANSLGVKYQISDPLYVSVQIANRLYSYNETGKVNQARGRSTEFTESYGADNFRAALGAGYSFGDHVSLKTGLIFDLMSYSHKLSTSTTGNDNWDWGKFTFGIPVYFKVELP
jgi:hypothetical protein